VGPDGGAKKGTDYNELRSTCGRAERPFDGQGMRVSTKENPGNCRRVTYMLQKPGGILERVEEAS